MEYYVVTASHDIKCKNCKKIIYKNGDKLANYPLINGVFDKTQSSIENCKHCHCTQEIKYKGHYWDTINMSEQSSEPEGTLLGESAQSDRVLYYNNRIETLETYLSYQLDNLLTIDEEIIREYNLLINNCWLWNLK